MFISLLLETSAEHCLAFGVLLAIQISNDDVLGILAYPFLYWSWMTSALIPCS